MNEILEFFNVNNTFFTVFNYQMSYVEFFGTILNILTVWLLVKKNIWNWPVGIVAVVLFGALFYQLNLYADLFEQGYYFVTGFIGWYLWAKAKKPKDEDEKIIVKRNTIRQNVFWLAGIGISTLIGAWAMAQVHIWLPALFPEPASLPTLDVLTTVMSFAAQLLMIYKRLENWVLWIIVDVIAIGLYWYKGVPFVALLYVIFLFLASKGLVTWYKTYKDEAVEEKEDEKRTSDRKVLPAA